MKAEIYTENGGEGYFLGYQLADDENQAGVEDQFIAIILGWGMEVDL